MLKLHWVMLGHLRNTGVTLAEVIGQYHARGVVPLRRRPLRLCDMTADRAPWVGTVTALSPPSPLEVQHRVAQVIGRSTYSWPPSRLLLMLPNAGTEKFVSCSSSRHVSFTFCHGVDLLGVCLPQPTFAFSCRHSLSVPTLSWPRRLYRRKRSLTRNRLRRRRGVARARNSTRSARLPSVIVMTTALRGERRGSWAYEDPSPEPSWSGDVASAAVDWSNVSGSSSSSLPRDSEVSSLRQPPAAQDRGLEHATGGSPRSRGPADGPLPCGAQRDGCFRAAEICTRQVDPPRRSEERPMSARPLYDGSDCPDSDSLQRRRSRGRSSDSASTPSAPPVSEPSAAP
jgi:hypothetical protein